MQLRWLWLYMVLSIFRGNLRLKADHRRTIALGLLLSPWLIGAETRWPTFSADIFKSIFLNENVWISIKIALKFVSRGQINNIPALFQIMAWRRPGDKPLSEPMMVKFTDAYMRHSASIKFLRLLFSYVQYCAIVERDISIALDIYNTRIISRTFIIPCPPLDYTCYHVCTPLHPNRYSSPFEI